jgi:hypothetical protein
VKNPNKFFLGIIALCVLLAYSCTNGNESIVKSLQKQVPFTIIVPSYLPSGFYPEPLEIGTPTEGLNDSIGISFTYKKRGNPLNMINVFEQNGTLIFHPSKPSSAFLNINGANVLEEDIEIIDPQGEQKDEQILTGFFYAWNSENVNLQVTILGYEKEECRKVIESMVKK